jgi:ankyrin repeat protein
MSIFDFIKSDDLQKITTWLKEHPEEIGAVDGAGRTPLHYAVSNNLLTVCEWLLAGGADIHAKDVSGQTPLHYATRNDLWSITVLLLNQGAEIDARMKDGCTPLHLASIHGYLQVVELLLTSGADGNAGDYDTGRTPLHYAILHADENSEQFIRRLLKEGVNINAGAKNGSTALHFAASLGHLEIAKLLVESGAEINAVDNAGRTPLHLAAEGRNPARPNLQTAIVKYLVEKGADTKIKAANGLTAIEMATRRGFLDRAAIITRSRRE